MAVTFLRTYRHVAHTYHWCDHCCTQINPGDYYEGEVFVNSKGLIVTKNHLNPDCPWDDESEGVCSDEDSDKGDLEKKLEKAA